MSVDVIGNFLTVIRNGIMAGKRFVTVPYSRLKHQMADLLVQEGFVNDVVVEGENAQKALRVVLRYVDGESAIHEVKRVSTPGRRVYERSTRLRTVIGGLGIAIVSTNKGLMTNKQAKESGLGGEVLCTVW